MRCKNLVVLGLAAAAALSLVNVSLEDGHVHASLGAPADAGRINFGRAFQDLGRAVDRAARGVQRGFHDAGRAIARTAHNVANTMKKGVQQLGQTVHKATVNAGTWIRNTAKSVGQAVNTVVKQAGTALKKAGDDIGKFVAKGFDVVKKAFCATIGMPICMVVDLIKGLAGFVGRLTKNKGDLGKTLVSYWEDFKNNLKKAGEDAKNKLTGLFGEFKAFLTLKDERQFGSKALSFAGRVFNTVKDITQSFTNLIGLPEFLGWGLGAINGLTVTATLSPAVVGLAAVNLGARKLFEWLLPELILGVGALANSATGGKAPTPPSGLLGTILNTLRQIAGPVAGGLIGVLVKDPKKKERIKAVLEKIANVADKVEQGISKVLSLSKTIATGKFEEVEKALADANKKSVPAEFTPAQMMAMIDGLLDFTGDEVWGLLNPKLRDVLGKGMSLLDRVFDIPRNALVAGVGSIPFAGGVLSSALNFGLGFVVDIVKGFLTGEIMGMCEFVFKDIIEGLKGAFKKRFFVASLPEPVHSVPFAELTDRQKELRQAVQINGNMKMLMGSLGDNVDGVKETLKTASLQHKVTVRALATTGLKDVLLRGVASVEVRELVGAAVVSMSETFTERSFTLSQGVGDVLRKVEIPLGELLASAAPSTRVGEVLRESLAALVRKASSVREARRLGKSDEGVLGALGVAVIEHAQPRLLGALVDENDSPILRRLVARELKVMSRAVRREGFGSLLRFGELFRGAAVRSARALASHFLPASSNPAMSAQLDVLAERAATRVLAGKSGGLVALLAEAANERTDELLANASGGGR